MEIDLSHSYDLELLIIFKSSVIKHWRLPLSSQTTLVIVILPIICSVTQFHNVFSVKPLKYGRLQVSSWSDGGYCLYSFGLADNSHMLSDFWIKIILHQIKIACNDWWCDFSSWLPNKNACINFYYIDQGPVAEFIFWYKFGSPRFWWSLARCLFSYINTAPGESEGLNRRLWIRNRIYVGDDFSMVITRSIL